MTTSKFKKNKYVCLACEGTIITVDLDEGTTPAYLACKSDVNCEGFMESKFYSPAQVGDEEPTHEWYRPTREERRAGNEALRSYYQRGGLALRRINNV